MDGLLTWDPKIQNGGGYRVRQLSHEEMADACKTGITLLELRSPKENGSLQDARYLENLCQQRTSAATLLGITQDVIYLAVESNLGDAEFEFTLEQCAEVHVRSRQAIVTLVGEGLRDSGMADRVSAALASSEAFILPFNPSPRCVCIAVSAKNLTCCLEVLARILYAEVHPRFFAESNNLRFEEKQYKTPAASVQVPETGRRPRDRSLVLAHPGTRA